MNQSLRSTTTRIHHRLKKKKKKSETKLKISKKFRIVKSKIPRTASVRPKRVGDHLTFPPPPPPIPCGRVDISMENKVSMAIGWPRCADRCSVYSLPRWKFCICPESLPAFLRWPSNVCGIRGQERGGKSVTAPIGATHTFARLYAGRPRNRGSVINFGA